jgi:arylsulfatase A-like enzyme
MKCILFLAVIAWTVQHGFAAETKQKPNVLFIAIDDLNDWIGCLGGHPQTKTPNFDRLAASGQLFTNAYCPGASCNPSRTAVFSGLPPHRSGLYENMQKMREVMPRVELMPKYFSRHGYQALGSGKLLHYIIDAQSWDEYHPAKETENPFPKTFNPPNRPISLPRAGKWQYNETDWAELDVTDEQYGGDWLVTKWVGEQLQQKHDKPFFLACGIYRPHEPWFVPKQYFEPFPLEKIQPGPGYRANDIDDLPPTGQKIAKNRYFEHIQAQQQWKPGIQAYLASIHYSDAMLGRVLQALDQSPHRDNTIVVLWSDHGWHLGEKEHWQKYTGWRLCARVPLMIRVPPGMPGLPKGTVAGATCHRPVSLVDLYRTLIDLCGLPEKADIHGHSLVPLLREPKTEWPYAAITHLNHPENYALSTERWRYIHYQNGDQELYDIQTDPHEWTNLANQQEHAQKLAELKALVPKQMAAKHETEPGINDFKAQEELTFVAASTGIPAASTLKSEKVSVLVSNSRQNTVRLVRLDEAGKRHPELTMAVASRRLLHTTAGQVWLVQDEQGKNLGHFVVGTVPASIRLE